jgi:hypothetical protein
MKCNCGDPRVTEEVPFDSLLRAVRHPAELSERLRFEAVSSSLNGNGCREATWNCRQRESFRNNDELTRRTDQTARQKRDLRRERCDSATTEVTAITDRPTVTRTGP